MKRIIFLLLILFLSFEISFAFSLDDITKSDDSSPANALNSLFKKNEYSFNSSDLIKDYKNASQYSVQILHDGKSVGPGKEVTFLVNGIHYTRLTDENGVATLNINLKPGNYIIYAEYKSCKNYNNILVL